MRLHLRIAVSLLSVFLFAAGCGGGDDSIPVAGLTGVVSGLVTDSAGAPISGVAVSSSTQSTTTGTDGRFAITELAGINSVLTLRAAKTRTTAFPEWNHWPFGTTGPAVG